MRTAFLILSILLSGFIPSMKTTAQSPDAKSASAMKLLGAVPLMDVNGRIDHLAYNNKAGIIYVAALGNNSVEVVDMNSRRVIHSIKGLDEPQGIRYLPENNVIVVANGGDGRVSAYDATTYKLVGSVNLGDDADNVRYDKGSGTVYIGYGNGAIGGVDATTFNRKFKVDLPGHPESFQLSGGNKIYVNIPDVKLIDVIDLKQGRVTAEWEIKEAASNFPMAVDETSHRVFIGCRNPAKVLVIDSQTGKSITRFDIDSDTDDIFYDESSGLIYVSCGGGYIDVIKQVTPDNYELFERIESAPGARTSLYIPELNQLVVAAPKRSGNNARLLIYGK
jgi:YVTN family beta-propeller protein